MRSSIVSLVAVIVLGLSFAARTAEADCNCVAVAGDVDAAIQAQIAKADGLYARGDFNAALAIYADVYASSRASVLLYAQGMANVSLGAQAKAREQFKAYLAAGGNLAYKAKAEAQLSLLGGAATAVGTGVGKVGGVVGGVGGDVVGGVRGNTPDVGGVAAGGVGATGAVVGGVKGNVEGKVKVGRKAGIVLGVIAIAALGAVAIHGIAAGISDDIELDPKFDLGMGIAGVSVGISAIYVAGLTAATTAAAGAPCLTEMQTRNAKPVGLAAGFRF